MLKKVLIFALILNTPYIMSSDSSANPRYDVAAICTLAGTMCTWLAYKGFKKNWQEGKEFDRHLTILNEMGIQVNKVYESEFVYNFGGGLDLVIEEHYTMDIPSHFSGQQEKKAKEHWSLLLTSDEERRKAMNWAALFSLGSIILIPTGIYAFYEALFQPK